MSIPTRPSVTGFFMSDPQLTENAEGVKRLYAPIGIDQSERNENGTFTSTEPYRTNLVMFGKSAERAEKQFVSGDNFIAVGRTNEREYNGRTEEQFIASRIGHDNNRSTYTVERGAPAREAATKDAPGQEAVEVPDPAVAALANRAKELGAETAEGTGPTSVGPITAQAAPGR